MDRNILEELHRYFEQKKRPTRAEMLFLSQLKEQLPYFEITTLHRDDLTSRGFIADNVDDCTMKEIARKMSNAYTNEQFWLDMEILAEDSVPKHRCPKCWDEAYCYNSDTERLSCLCGHDWEEVKESNRYVKVEHPEDATFFNDNEIGYDCFNSDDNGARYVCENLYTAHTGKKPKQKQIYQPIQWPESQTYLEWEHTAPKKFEKCELINAAIGFDSNAIWVPISLIKRK